MRKSRGEGRAEEALSAPSRRELLTTAAIAGVAVALPGCATVSGATVSAIDGLAAGGCRARYCRHFRAGVGLAEGTGRCSLSAER